MRQVRDPRIATTTTNDGKTVPDIVRIDAGVINRAVYQLAILDDPTAATANADYLNDAGLEPQVVVSFGGGSGTQYVQGNVQPPTPPTAGARGARAGGADAAAARGGRQGGAAPQGDAPANARGGSGSARWRRGTRRRCRRAGRRAQPRGARGDSRTSSHPSW